MLAEIIKQVSGSTWQDYIHKQLFVPAGMNNSYLTDFYRIIPNRAQGYMHKRDTLINATAMLYNFGQHKITQITVLVFFPGLENKG